MYNPNRVNVRPLPAPRQRSQPVKPPKRHKTLSLLLSLALSGLLIYGGIAISELPKASADAPVPEIRSGKAGYCLDDSGSSTSPGTAAEAYSCNGSSAQQFVVSGAHIVRSARYCLALNAAKVVIDPCNQSKSENWSADGVGLKNDSNGKCLSLPGGKTDAQLITANCSGLISLNETWTPGVWPGESIDMISSPACSQTDIGERVACVAQNEWVAWQTEPSLHKALLNDYTDGNPSEEWCADFVSFVYAEAGVPFSNGERDGWDEYNANYIQYQGFTYHAADSGYIPKPGDVAYFDYSGGHVEIVVSGGKHPTFVYGDSGTIDPITNNGDMAQNQIQNDGSAGQLVYYLSPDPGV